MVLQPDVTEIGIQTKESKSSNMSDLNREDLLELLRELVVTPRQHLDSVMELIEMELSQPDISYNKMLRHVHEYSAIDVRLLSTWSWSSYCLLWFVA